MKKANISITVETNINCMDNSVKKGFGRLRGRTCSSFCSSTSKREVFARDAKLSRTAPEISLF